MTHDGLRSRKLIASAVVFATATLLVIIGKLTGEAWADMVPLLLAVYVGGNVGERFAARGKGDA